MFNERAHDGGWTDQLDSYVRHQRISLALRSSNGSGVPCAILDQVRRVWRIAAAEFLASIQAVSQRISAS